MIEIRKLLENLAYDFLNNHFEKIEKHNDGETKKSLLKDIKTDDYTLMWVISELMTNMKVLKDIEVENNEGLFVLKLNNRYINFDFDNNTFIEVFPKVKEIIYFV